MNAMRKVKIVVPPRAGATGVAARVQAVSRIPAGQLATVPPAPKSVKMELTAQCDWRCAFCGQPSREKKRGEMGWPLFTRLVGEMADAGVEEVGFFFLGESFLCDWLPDAIGHAKARGIPFAFLTTNGSSATPERVKACMEAGLDSLKFSVNFADEHQFRDVALARPGLYRDALDNLRSARRVRDEGGHACGLYASSLDLGPGHAERMEPVLAEVLPYVDEHYWQPLHAKGGPMPIPCWSVFTQAHVTFDGKLSACGFEADGAAIMADLTHVSFLEGWQSERFARLRNAHLERDVTCTLCEDCGRAR
ncbi:MAG TPA: radical SAM/SPASM domain-containing protein [Usitatibacter sp.]|nr:radical SAM/SPASM domain-containing protein [Usitatibacter sp.]